MAAALLLVSGCTEDAPTDPGTSTALLPYYDRVPNPSACDAGALKNSERQNVLARLNALRALHGLPATTYNSTKDGVLQRAALVCAANNTLNHQPPQNFNCWTQEAYYGCNTSNLAFYSAAGSTPSAIALPRSETFIDLWLIDTGNPELGHRRWLLNPFLRDITFGRVDRKMSETEFRTFAAVKVLDTNYNPGPTDAPVSFIAYPQGGYASTLVRKDWYMSFSLLIDKTDFWANENVDYSNATVEVLDPNNNRLNVRSIAYDNLPFGLPNNLRWITDGLQDVVIYRVTINGIVAKGQPVVPVQYTFHLVP